MSSDYESTSIESNDNTEQTNEELPKLVFDENRIALITTHIGNTYKVKKLSDAAFMNAISAGGETKVGTSMVALVAASLIDPVRTRTEVENGFFDGELFYLSEVIGNYYNANSSFLNKDKPQTLYNTMTNV